jgi:multicomponent Na+:H+ antiporter subunit E
MRILLLNLILVVLWMFATGVFTLANAVLGFFLTFLVLAWVQPLLGRTNYFRKLPLACAFTLVFLWEVVKSNVRVAWDVLTPRTLRRPGIVAVPLDANTPLEIATLANVITLTPGTLCLDVSDDRRTMYVHAMFVDDPDEVRRQIKDRFERWILVLLRA